MGTAVGGILGGGQMLAAGAVSAVQNIGNERATLKANTQLFDHSILNDFSNARKYFIDFAKNNFPKSVVNQESGRPIGISRIGLDKFLSGNLYYTKYASGFHIPELIENAYKVGEANNYHETTVASIPTYEYFDCPIEIDQKQYTAHIRVKNTTVGDKYYGHTISEVVDIRIESPTRSSVPQNKTVHPENIGDSTEDIHHLLDKGVQFPQLLADDILTKNNIANPQDNVKPNARNKIFPNSSNAARPFASTPHDYAALLRKLAKEREDSETLTPEQETRLDTWNLLFPEMRMTADEFLAR